MYDGWAVSKRDRCPRATLICQMDNSEFSQEVRQIYDKDYITGSNPVTRTYCKYGKVYISKSGCHWDSKSTLILL